MKNIYFTVQIKSFWTFEKEPIPKEIDLKMLNENGLNSQSTGGRLVEIPSIFRP